jgi:protein-disulfide isomerase
MKNVPRALLIAFCLMAGSVAATEAGAEDLGTVPKNALTAILRNPGTPPVGANQANVTFVEYFDYNCPFCKKLSPALQGLLAADPKAVLIYKDWPILGEVSRYAAAQALAAGWQGKYPAAHDALMSATRLQSNAQVDDLLKNAGIDMVLLSKDREAHATDIATVLTRNDTEARALGIRGTPGLLVGHHIINGVYDVSGLEQAAAIARHD